MIDNTEIKVNESGFNEFGIQSYNGLYGTTDKKMIILFLIFLIRNSKNYVKNIDKIIIYC
ncbi:hypothetical protein NNC19_03465 [Clostridium sp. SHJSY1]|uniref:hypothetical protein n=1 Tax=Clostridium sp. SHJSY1 TaxID=2942483 RepID=UPI0028772451|nr:hypothetical protein [Clostridium sp. SHJSY1]MDS0524724.1 hypothetical protein [Clostridium sp. SHJSY1]